MRRTELGRAPAARSPTQGFDAADARSLPPSMAGWRRTAAPLVPCWKRWKYWSSQVTELSLAFRAAAERIGYTFIGPEPELERLQRQIAAARRALVDIDHAAARLSTGRFGYCEQCGTDIPVARLATIPEARYCPGCSAGTP